MILREQASSRKSGGTDPPATLRQAAAAFAAIFCGAVAGWGAEFEVGPVTLPIAFAFGVMTGWVVLRTSGPGHSSVSAVSVAVLMILGAVAGRLAVGVTVLAMPYQAVPDLGLIELLVRLFTPDPYPALTLVAAAAGAVYRVRKAGRRH